MKASDADSSPIEYQTWRVRGQEEMREAKDELMRKWQISCI